MSLPMTSRTSSRILTTTLFLLGLCAALSAPQAHAGNGDELIQLSRYHCTNCRYGDPRKCSNKENCHECRDCQMSWQPIRSIMHPNMMPAGMIRPKPPLNRMVQNLIPKTPAVWLQKCWPWSGCKDGRCQAP